MQSTKLKNLPNALTFGNMAIGILVICLMLHNNSLFGIKFACCLIYSAVILDLLDGHLARYLNASSEMGKQLDSFADFITFGVAPIAIFVSSMDFIPWYVMIVVLLYPLAGGFRLARYNLQEHCEYFTGLPITASAFIMISILLGHICLNGQFTTQFIIFYLFIMLALSVMMVSSFRVNRILKKEEACTRQNHIN
ncbi:MAG TPA: CDP-diacylglycerol--serine O-phosphatidyltransferase [Clostridiales bacterium]|nr:CDP-diacylglycerol--serine O-phosphatidyltransferase [Clostridiales bacterium]